MSKPDVETFQSYCRTYFNRAINKHFRDVDGSDDASLSTAAPRQLIKRICLHKDTDTMTLTLARMLTWWVEAGNLLDEYIYGIPSTDFEISNTYYPQVKLHFREDKYEAYDNDRKVARSEVSFRWREEDYSTVNINQLATKILNDFAKPVFFYRKGRKAFTYWDKEKAYRFTVYTDDGTDAKKIIEQVIRIQDNSEPDWDNNLREHKDGKDYNVPGSVRVMAKLIRKPKRRPLATVKFAYAELFIPGTTQPIVLVDASGYKTKAIKRA
ncbi:hypothetical protein [Pleurocapsa sp. FMAR1]|uniref:hypothetical protein n=1 Tax=Pleurocapsa sp. FMAR1 TaxID=3040204 RepID=UPI0029C7B98A|nr:hypothetical protein [Pleurocapsa sp. FMAR1]